MHFGILFIYEVAIHVKTFVCAGQHRQNPLSHIASRSVARRISDYRVVASNLDSSKRMLLILPLIVGRIALFFFDALLKTIDKGKELIASF